MYADTRQEHSYLLCACFSHCRHSKLRLSHCCPDRECHVQQSMCVYHTDSASVCSLRGLSGSCQDRACHHVYGVYACMYVCKYVCVYLCMYLCMCLCVSQAPAEIMRVIMCMVCVYVCMYVSMYVYMYICMYACMCLYSAIDVLHSIENQRQHKFPSRLRLTC
jgi:hypothetical protein